MKKIRSPRERFSARLIAIANVIALAAVTYFAQPVAGGPTQQTVVHGDVTFVHQGNKTIIYASDGSIINYLSFDILPWEKVKFIQPHDLARVLNRITGPEPTLIQGKLLANGQVYIVNPAGVMFTGNAVVNVGGLYAAAGNISDNHFLQGKDKFTDLSGDVVNHGLIKGDQIHLMGRHVANHGTLKSHKGIITMLAGDVVYLKEHGEKLTVRVDGKRITDRKHPFDGSSTPDMTLTPGVENTGTIKNKKGRVLLGAGDLAGYAIHNSGSIKAKKGDVALVAKDGLVHNSGDITVSTNKGTAGSITVQGPSVLNEGSIAADSNKGHAGSVEVTSQNHTYLTDGSEISAAGGTKKAHGGDVLVHSYEGETVFAHGSEIDVSGGKKGGHGGFAEVSGDSLIFNGSVDLKGKHGYDDGTLLIDPANIFVEDVGADDGFLADDIIEFTEGGTVDDAVISDEALEAIFGDIQLEADQSIFVNFEVDLVNANNVSLFANDSIFFNESINGMNNLLAVADADGNAAGIISIDAPLALDGNAFFHGPAIELGGGEITSGGIQFYDGPVTLTDHANLTGSQVAFKQTVDAQNDGVQKLITNGRTTFGGAVGGAPGGRLKSVRVHGESLFGGGLVRTTETQRYFGEVQLGSDMHFQSTGGATIRFADAVNSGSNDLTRKDILVTTSGLTRFDGPVGNLRPLDVIATDAAGKTKVSGDQFANIIDYDDPVSLGDDVTLNAEISVDFAQTVQGADHDLIINSPLTSFHGDATKFDLLRTDADGVTIIDTARITGEKIDFRDRVELEDDALVRGNTFVKFHQTVDGAHDLTAKSHKLIYFGGNVGETTALDSLTTVGGKRETINKNLVVIDSELIRATGDIDFNPQGKNQPARVATVVANGPLTIESTDGDVSFGENEKMTALHDLNIEANNGRVTLSDTNADGHLAINADAIRIRAREPGTLFDFKGDLIPDDGVEIIATNSIDFSTAPTVIGSGARPLFATKSGGNMSGNLASFDRLSISGLNTNRFTFDGTVLDLSITVAAATTRRPGELATSLDDSPSRVHDRVELEPFALRPLERLAIYMRSLSNSELVGAVSGRELYNDLGGTGGTVTTAANRLRRENVIAVLDRHAAIFLRQRPELESSEIEIEDQTGHIRETFARAWRGYVDQPHDDLAFREYLARNEAAADARALAAGLADLFREVWTMGVTRLEMRNALDAVLGPVTPETMDQRVLEEALGVELFS